MALQQRASVDEHDLLAARSFPAEAKIAGTSKLLVNCSVKRCR